MKQFPIAVSINGHHCERVVDPMTRLVDFIRDDIGLRGTKISCGVQVCGVCTVLLDDDPISSCSFLAIDVDGREITTIEGVADNGVLGEFQQALLEHGGVQCGYCTPGFVMTMESIKRACPARPIDEAGLVHALEGNICRCTGYRQILNAAKACSLVPSTDRPAKDANTENRGSGVDA
jgi:carbon-monoxide dehydrogenase small subunit